MSAPTNPSLIAKPIGISAVWSLAWPVTISMLSYTFMALADTLFVSWLGTSHMAAIGIAAVASFSSLAFGLGLLAGVKVAVAQYTGAGDTNRANRLAWQAGWLALALGLSVAALAPASPFLFPLLGVGDKVEALAISYFAIRVLGAPLVFASAGLTAWYQGKGDMRTPMIANLIANGLNVALDPLFIFGFWFIPRLEMTGAAIATVISTGVAAGFLVLCNAKMLKRTPWRPHWALIRQSCRFGIPIGIQRFLGCLGFLGFVIILGRCGEAHLAAHVLVIRVMSISFLPGHAISEAASVLVGQSVGARRADRAFEAWRAATLLAIAIMVSCGAVFVAFPGPFIQLFGAADQVAEIARSLMVIAAVVQIFDAIAMVGLGSINGSGDTRYSMFVSVMCAWLVQLPLALWLAIALNWGATGAWLGLTAEIILLAALALHRVLSGRWLRRTGLVHVRRPTPAFV